MQQRRVSLRLLGRMLHVALWGVGILFLVGAPVGLDNSEKPSSSIIEGYAPGADDGRLQRRRGCRGACCAWRAAQVAPGPNALDRVPVRCQMGRQAEE